MCYFLVIIFTSLLVISWIMSLLGGLVGWARGGVCMYLSVRLFVYHFYIQSVSQSMCGIQISAGVLGVGIGKLEAGKSKLECMFYFFSRFMERLIGMKGLGWGVEGAN